MGMCTFCTKPSWKNRTKQKKHWVTTNQFGSDSSGNYSMLREILHFSMNQFDSDSSQNDSMLWVIICFITNWFDSDSLGNDSQIQEILHITMNQFDFRFFRKLFNASRKLAFLHESVWLVIPDKMIQCFEKSCISLWINLILILKEMIQCLEKFYSSPWIHSILILYEMIQYYEKSYISLPNDFILIL